MRAASMVAARWGIVTTVQPAVPTIEELVARYGAERACVGVRAADVSVLDARASDRVDAQARARCRRSARRRTRCARPMIMGCAGMSTLHARAVASRSACRSSTASPRRSACWKASSLGLATSKRGTCRENAMTSRAPSISHRRRHGHHRRRRNAACSTTARSPSTAIASSTSARPRMSRSRYMAKRTLDARRKAVLPGLIDCHAHAGHGLLKTIGGGDADAWMDACRVVYTVGSDEHFWYAEARLAALERIRCGTTTGVCLFGGGDSIMRVDDPRYAARHCAAIAGSRHAVVPCRGPVAAAGAARLRDVVAAIVASTRDVDWSTMRAACDEIVRTQHGAADGRVHICIVLPVWQPQHDPEHREYESTFREQAAEYADVARSRGLRITQDGHRDGTLVLAQRARTARPRRVHVALDRPDTRGHRGVRRDRRQHRAQPERDHVDPRPLPRARADRSRRQRGARLRRHRARPQLRHVPPHVPVHALPPAALPRRARAAAWQGARNGHDRRRARARARARDRLARGGEEGRRHPGRPLQAASRAAQHAGVPHRELRQRRRRGDHDRRRPDPDGRRQGARPSTSARSWKTRRRRPSACSTAAGCGICWPRRVPSGARPTRPRAFRTANILANREFVVHIADEPMAEQMHRCGDDLPVTESELFAVGFTTRPARAVKPPCIAEAPVAFECVLAETLETPSRHILIGQVLWLHARDDLIDLERYRVRLQNFFPVARFGASFYIRTRDRFSLSGGHGGSESTGDRRNRMTSCTRRSFATSASPTAPTVDVLVEGGTIASIVPAGRGAASICPSSSKASGQLLLPALVESHVHFDKTLWGLPWRPNTRRPDAQRSHRQRAAPSRQFRRADCRARRAAHRALHRARIAALPQPRRRAARVGPAARRGDARAARAVSRRDRHAARRLPAGRHAGPAGHGRAHARSARRWASTSSAASIRAAIDRDPDPPPRNRVRARAALRQRRRHPPARSRRPRPLADRAHLRHDRMRAALPGRVTISHAYCLGAFAPADLAPLAERLADAAHLDHDVRAAAHDRSAGGVAAQPGRERVLGIGRHSRRVEPDGQRRHAGARDADRVALRLEQGRGPRGRVRHRDRGRRARAGRWRLRPRARPLAPTSCSFRRRTCRRPSSTATCERTVDQPRARRRARRQVRRLA